MALNHTRTVAARFSRSNASWVASSSVLGRYNSPFAKSAEASSLGFPNSQWHPTSQSVHCRRLSSSAGTSEKKGIFGRMKEKLDDRAKRNQEVKYAEQLQKMAESEKWDLQAFSAEVDSSLSGWRSKIPGMSNVQQMKEMKESQKVIHAVKEAVGGGATARDLTELGRKDKLKISLETGISIEDLNLLIQQFQGMDLMHKVLRYRKLNGKPIPTDEDGMKSALRSDGDNVITKKQKKEMHDMRKRGMLGNR